VSDTIIDIAHAKMTANPEDDASRLSFYESVADSELFLLLGDEPTDDNIVPELFDIQGQKYALVFDREERLAEFVGRAAPYAGVPGRGLVQMLNGQSVGLALNLEVAPSSMMIPPEAIDWLSDVLLHGPDAREAKLKEITSPAKLPSVVDEALSRKLSQMPGMAAAAYLASSTFDNGERGHIFAFVDAKEGSEDALAHAIGETLNFSGIEAGSLDVMFIRSEDALSEVLERVGKSYAFPVLQQPSAPVAPGMDPENPPKLR
jgi:hypothetical protein